MESDIEELHEMNGYAESGDSHNDQERATVDITSFDLGILRLNSDFSDCEADLSFLRVFNCEQSEISGRSIEDLLNPDAPETIVFFHKQISTYVKGETLDIYPIELVVGKAVHLCHLRVRQEGEGWCVLAEKVSARNSVFQRLHQNELKWRAMTLSVSVGIAVLTEQDRLLEFNDSFVGLMNFRSKDGIMINEEALKMRDIFTLLQADVAHPLRTSIETWRKRTRNDIFSVLVLHEGKYLEIEASPIFSRCQTYQGCALIVKDRTANRKLEILNAEREQVGHEIEAILVQLEEAQAIAKIGSWSFDLVTWNLTWSKELFKICEIPEPQPKEALYQLFRSRVHPDDIETLDHFVNRAQTTGEGYVWEHRLLFDDGRVKHIEGIGRVKLDDHGKPVLIRGTCRDISDELKAKTELEIERTKSIHGAKLASLGEMAAGIAHEINTPLAVISMSLSLLEKFRDNPDKFSIKVESMRQSVERISRIVRGLQKFSRSDSEADRIPARLSKIVREAMVLTEPRFQRYSTIMTVDLRSDAKILCDEVEIEQVIINLLNNAIDAVKELAEKWVHISLYEDGSEVVLRIRDSGMGIHHEVEKRLFQPFFTTKPVGEGTGLGLSIAKGILDRHMGRITVDHGDNHTCFVVRLPVLPALIEARMRFNVMYVDDDKAICESFAEMFGSEEFNIVTFVDPANAIEAAKHNPPDLVFLDYRLPFTTGDVVAQSLAPEIPKVLVTGDLSVATTYKFEKIIFKPYKPEEIWSVLNEHKALRSTIWVEE